MKLRSIAVFWACALALLMAACFVDVDLDRDQPDLLRPDAGPVPDARPRFEIDAGPVSDAGLQIDAPVDAGTN